MTSRSFVIAKKFREAGKAAAISGMGIEIASPDKRHQGIEGNIPAEFAELCPRIT